MGYNSNYSALRRWAKTRKCMDNKKLKAKFENGVYTIPIEGYHRSEGYSRSAIMTAKTSLYHFWYKHLSGLYQSPGKSPEFIIGDALHTWALEPNLWEERFIVMPTCDRRTKAGKAIYAEFEEMIEGQDLQVISDGDFLKVDSMARIIRQEGSLAESLIADAEIEESIFFTHKLTGLQCKVRPDIWNHSIVGDLKTCKDASYRSFQSSSVKYGYFLQAAMIDAALDSIGIDMEKFVFIAIEKEAPYAMGLYLVEEDALQYGRDLFDNLMIKIAHAVEHDEWPGYGLQSLYAPAYAKFDLDGE